MKVAVFGSGHMPSLVAVGKKGRGISITGANTLLSSHHYVFVVVVVGFFCSKLSVCLPPNPSISSDFLSKHSPFPLAFQPQVHSPGSHLQDGASLFLQFPRYVCLHGSALLFLLEEYQDEPWVFQEHDRFFGGRHSYFLKQDGHAGWRVSIMYLFYTQRAKLTKL